MRQLSTRPGGGQGVEAESLIGDMDEGDVAEALEEAGIEADGASVATMKEALKVHYAGKVRRAGGIPAPAPLELAESPHPHRLSWRNPRTRAA